MALSSIHHSTTPVSTVSRCAPVRGGYIALRSGSLRDASYASIYWSATTYPNTTSTYLLHFDGTNILPSDYDNRYYGFSVH